MTPPKILVAFYSTYGTNHAMAEAAAEAAREAGADVRLRRFAETAPKEVVESQEAWAAQLEKMKDIPEVSHDDISWADGFFWSVPTRFGAVPSQVRAFVDTLGGLWQSGELAKPFTATTSAGNPHGGQETTLLQLYGTAIHFGAIIVTPGYTDESIAAAGGNPYGYSALAGKFDEAGRNTISYQARRLVEVTGKLLP
ncbi:NAD(P)H-dependent oxidoreductase [Poseidonocella sedimentorum]|uniref:NAD(P)H dehydrogenase (Quinone) n=1 Tax=Poseidonocella sedimentorum TaxID=871652 RepID=A0A1I6DI56_9RHOB|nr:NAD(P)H-dependent oxidoreductase [Poseidonocella sedimentorum]SFR05022.1 NAD(P)H dehydrogenase (quinone) [Poseidonocella sedimentorum]